MNDEKICIHESLVQDIRYTLFGKDGRPGARDRIVAMEVVIEQLTKDINKIGDAFRKKDDSIDRLIQAIAKKETRADKTLNVVKWAIGILALATFSTLTIFGALIAGVINAPG